MLTSRKTIKPLSARLGFVFTIVFILGFLPSSIALSQKDNNSPTTITISDTPTLTNARRLGVNLGTQDFWDSGLIMRNLAFRNPGFEAMTWQSTLHCQSVTATSCTDDNLYNYWPAGFINGASASFIYGPATGTVATVASSTPSVIGKSGITIQLAGLSTAPSVGDYIVVRTSIPGNAQAGWWPNTTGGATVSTDTTDLSPNTPGKQALSLNAAGAGQQIYLSNFDDGLNGRMFVKLSGNYNISFRAKGTGGSNKVVITLVRNVAGGPIQFFNQTVNLTNNWQDYSYDFPINNDGPNGGGIALTFNVYQSSMLIDDVSFTEAAAPNNPTPYRNAVVSTLQSLHPGTLRYMDSGINWGSSIDNILAPDFARLRTGNSPHNSEIDDIAMGLPGFLALCQTIGAEPWYSMPTGMTTQEMTNLMEYLGGSSSTVYGAKRAAAGQNAPWTSVFPTIHLEFGNEVWNTGNPGANMTDPTAYGKRAATIFATAKASPSYSAKTFDLVLGGFEALPFWTHDALAASSDYDSVDVASYNFNYFNDGSSLEKIFGPMLAEPEFMNDDPGGLTVLNTNVAATAGPTPAHLAVYETNMDANQGSATQAQVQTAIPSLGAGLAVAANMLLAQRDLGVNNQNLFALEGLNVGFSGTTANSARTSPLWGVTIDMGGATDLRRPVFLSEQLANMAILPTLLATSQSGSNPTWDQPFSTNDNFKLAGAHYIQSIAYTDGTTLNIVLFNLNRTDALRVRFDGLNAPDGTATMSTLTGPSIDANNETSENVSIQTFSQDLHGHSPITLPPYSMTVLSVPAPYIAPIVTGVTATCANSALSPSRSTTCSASVTGQGKYDPGFTWSASAGNISSSGAYTAPATLPNSGRAVITATSNGNSSESASFTVLLAQDSITGVTASCPATSVGQGKILNCSASVQGTGSFSNTYSWSASSGTITPTGSFTAPSNGTSATLTATSTEDPSKSASVTLVLNPTLIMSQLSSSVSGTSITLSWQLNLSANSAISYGTGPSQGLSTPYDATRSTTPSITLTGLKPSTTYYLTPYSFLNGQTAGQTLSLTTTNGATAVTGVSVNCSALSLVLGASTGCAATVQGSGNYSSGVAWSSSLGSISSTGVLTAPLDSQASVITVTATSVADSSKSGSINISLNPVNSITAIAVSCQANTIVEGSSTTCSPKVTSTGTISHAVTWSASAGTITSEGFLTSPNPGDSVTVTATSVANPAKSASATIKLTALPTITNVSVTCQAASVTVGGSTACSSSVAGTGSYTSAVTWSTSAGSITSAGVLTAPSTGTSVKVRATSTQDPTISGVAFVTLAPTLAISNPHISVTSTTVTVSWTVNNAQTHSLVQWGTPNILSSTPYDPNTTANPSYTLSGFTPGSAVNLVITSFVGNESVSMDLTTATTDAPPAVSSISVGCSTGTVPAGKSLACSAAVAGTGHYSSAVTWSASAGSINSAGLLTAPTTGELVTVKATSVQDPTKYGIATVHVTEILAIVNPVFSVTPTTIVVFWTVTQEAHNGINYGPTTAYGGQTPYQNTVTTHPSFTFTGLTPGATYKGQLFSQNSSGKATYAVSVTTPLK